jgi:hypothetical protein
LPEVCLSSVARKCNSQLLSQFISVNHVPQLDKDRNTGKNSGEKSQDINQAKEEREGWKMKKITGSRFRKLSFSPKNFV